MGIVDVLTIQPRVIGLNVRLLDLTILNHEGVPLASWTSKDCAAIEREVEGVGKI